MKQRECCTSVSKSVFFVCVCVCCFGCVGVLVCVTECCSVPECDCLGSFPLCGSLCLCECGCERVRTSACVFVSE